MELNIKDFDELEQYFKRKQQHTEELEHLNTELTIENRKLQRKVDELQRLQGYENGSKEVQVSETSI